MLAVIHVRILLDRSRNEEKKKYKNLETLNDRFYRFCSSKHLEYVSRALFIYFFYSRSMIIFVDDYNMIIGEI